MANERNASKETGRSRAQRIHLDYYRHRGALYWSRWGFAGVGLLLAGGYVGWIAVGDAPAKHLSTGPLALGHAAFEQDCEKCHQPLSPLAGDAWRPKPDQAVAAIAAACRNCHTVDGHHRPHLNAAGARLDSHCSLCHRDHQGREHRLVALSDDAACLQCHTSLATARKSSSGEPLKSDIQSFTAESHGEFASLRSDAGRIHFDHAQHLQPGQVDPGQRGGFRIDMLAPADSERYRRGDQSDKDLVQLDCASCHSFEGSSSHAMNAADGELGRYPDPIRFDRHCAACHSLTHRGQSAEQLPLPHAAPWKEIAALLRAKTASGRLQGEIRMPRDAVRRKPVPGTFSDSSDIAEPATPSAELLDGEMEQAIESVRARCLQCHREDDVTGSAIAAAAKRDEPSMIPSRWLRRGLFDHASHPGLHCAFCHAEAYAELPDELRRPFDGAALYGAEASFEKQSEPEDHRQVMIRGIESCTPCHRDIDATSPPAMDALAAEGWLGTTSSWASASCTTCHRYHWSRPSRSNPTESKSAAVVVP